MGGGHIKSSDKQTCSTLFDLEPEDGVRDCWWTQPLKHIQVFPSGQGGRHVTACRSVFPTVPFFLQNSGLHKNVRVSYTSVFVFFSWVWLFLCACLGFTTQQAEIIVSALVKITETNMNIVYSDTVTKVQQVTRAGWVDTLEIRK